MGITSPHNYSRFLSLQDSSLCIYPDHKMFTVATLIGCYQQLMAVTITITPETIRNFLVIFFTPPQFLKQLDLLLDPLNPHLQICPSCHLRIDLRTTQAHFSPLVFGFHSEVLAANSGGLAWRERWSRWWRECQMRGTVNGTAAASSLPQEWPPNASHSLGFTYTWSRCSSYHTTSTEIDSSNSSSNCGNHVTLNVL